MELDQKLAGLKNAYRIYGRFVERYELSCEKNCDACCTCNVTMTTLEAYRMLKDMDHEKRSILLRRLADAPKRRFRPRVTFNEIARLCMLGEEVPEDPCDPSWGRCPFLEENYCVFYELRPFGCRCMCSVRRCSEAGYAEMPPLLMSVNDVFMQFIEHLDADGYSGNLADVLAWMSQPENRRKYEQGERADNAGVLAANLAMPALMVLPEHRNDIKLLVAELRKILEA